GVDDTTVSRLAWTLIHCVWQGFIVYGLFRGGEAMLAGRRANVRYAFALCALSLMAACPLVTWHRLGDAGIAVTQRFIEESQSASIVETTTVVAAADFDWRWPLLSLWLV